MAFDPITAAKLCIIVPFPIRRIGYGRIAIHAHSENGSVYEVRQQATINEGTKVINRYRERRRWNHRRYGSRLDVLCFPSIRLARSPAYARRPGPRGDASRARAVVCGSPCAVST